MTTDLIEAFMQLVELRNFNRAADALCISQSALSHRLNLLEEEVGLTLITRSRGNRSLALTQAGIEFIAIADQWLRLEKSTQTFRADYYQRRLSVGTIESISFLFSPFYRDLIFRENEDRKLRLDIHVYPSYQVIQAIESLEVDIGFTAVQRASQNIKAEPIFRERHYLVGNLDCAASSLNPKDLDPEKELVTNWSNAYQSWHEEYLGSEIHSLVSVDTAVLAAQCLEEGTWCIAPACTVPFLQKNAAFYGHQVQVYEIQNPPPERICYKVTNLSPRANRIDSIHYLEQMLAAFLRANNLRL